MKPVFRRDRIRLSPLLATACLVSIMVGCGGMDSRTASSLRQAEEAATARPQEALEKLATILEKYPDDVRAHRAKGLALEATNDLEGALAEWTYLARTRHSMSANRKREAHQNFIRLALQIQGSPPHRVDGPALGDEANLAEQMGRSARQLLAANKNDDLGHYGLGMSEYLRGRHAQARNALDTLVRLTPGHGEGAYLLLLVEESLAGISPESIERFVELFHSHPDTRVEVFSHLIWIAEKGNPEERAMLTLDQSIQALRGAELSPEQQAQVAEFERRLADRKNRELAERRYLDHLEAKRRNQWESAWELISEAAELHSPLEEARASFAQEWFGRLLQDANVALERRDIDEAERLLGYLANIPDNFLGAEDLTGRSEFTEAFEVEALRHAVKRALSRARSALDDRDPKTALSLLDEVETDVKGNQRVDYDVLYAEALHYYDRPDEAMKILDELNSAGALDRFRDNVIYRIYGVLLARAGRSEHAERVLNDLPLELKNSEAFGALLTALEKQGKWEAVLAHLNTLSFIPDTYRPILVRCASEAARRRLRGSDPDAALRLLESYLEERDFALREVQEVQLQILIELGDFDRASDIILTADLGLIKGLPAALVQRVKSRASDQLSERQQFGLFRMLLEREKDADMEARTLELWPRYGPYLPDPGKYVANYQVRRVSPDGQTTDLKKIDYVMEWERSRFVVTPSGRSPEVWSLADGIWTVSSQGTVFRYPARISGRPPYPIQQFRADSKAWNTQIVEAGVRVAVQGRTYASCLKIRVSTDSSPDAYTYLYLGPAKGLVLREEYQFDQLVEVQELLGLLQTAK